MLNSQNMLTGDPNFISMVIHSAFFPFVNAITYPWELLFPCDDCFQWGRIVSIVTPKHMERIPRMWVCSSQYESVESQK